MSELMLTQLNATDLAPPPAKADAEALAAELGELSGVSVYPRSISAVDKSLFFKIAY